LFIARGPVAAATSPGSLDPAGLEHRIGTHDAEALLSRLRDQRAVERASMKE
jgi:hypothetical protein